MMMLIMMKGTRTKFIFQIIPRYDELLDSPVWQNGIDVKYDTTIFLWKLVGRYILWGWPRAGTQSRVTLGVVGGDSSTLPHAYSYFCGEGPWLASISGVGCIPRQGGSSNHTLHHHLAAVGASLIWEVIRLPNLPSPCSAPRLRLQLEMMSWVRTQQWTS